MKTIVHKDYGIPGEVLQIVELQRATTPAADRILVGVSLSPIHPGDLLSIEGSPAFGTRTAIPQIGRIPGVEGIGRIIAIGSKVKRVDGIRLGARVAFFLGPGGAWSSQVEVTPEALLVLPDHVADAEAASMFANIPEAIYPAEQIVQAVTHARRPGKTGSVLLSFA